MPLERNRTPGRVTREAQAQLTFVESPEENVAGRGGAAVIRERERLPPAAAGARERELGRAENYGP